LIFSAAALVLHILSVVIWLGGMIFAHQMLRPVAASVLEPPQRLALWAGVLSRFFPWVWAAVILLLTTGLWLIFDIYDGFARAPLYVHAMFGLGLVMMALFFHVYFAPFKRLKAAVQDEAWPDGAAQIAQIRRLVGINVLLGIATVVAAAGGGFLL
jgi:uncharacterized membrane protein